MVLVQKWPFFQLIFFQAIKARKMPFTIFQNEKAPFQCIKRRSSKSRKIDIFSKGLTRGLVQKWPFFKNDSFQAIQARKMSFKIFQNKKKPVQAIKTRSSKCPIIDIFLKSLTRGLVQKWPFFQNGFFQVIQARKMSFTIFQNEKKPFQVIKTRSSKCPIIDIFLKRLTRGLVQKWPFFQNVSFQAIKARKMSFTIFQNEKSPF